MLYQLEKAECDGALAIIYACRNGLAFVKSAPSKVERNKQHLKDQICIKLCHIRDENAA